MEDKILVNVSIVDGLQKEISMQKGDSLQKEISLQKKVNVEGVSQTSLHTPICF